MQNLTKFTHFEMILIHERRLTKKKHVIYWGNYMYFNNKLQKTPFIFFYMNK